jgi:hypothetical protein
MGVELEVQNFSPRSQSSIPMRFCARLSADVFHAVWSDKFKLRMVERAEPELIRRRV